MPEVFAFLEDFTNVPSWNYGVRDVRRGPSEQASDAFMACAVLYHLGPVDRLKQRFPEKTLIPLSGAAICGNMKMNNLAKLAWSLDHLQHEIILDEDIRRRAERSLRRMLEQEHETDLLLTPGRASGEASGLSLLGGWGAPGWAWGCCFSSVRSSG